MDTSSPSSSSKMLTDCLDKSESCLSIEHRVKPHTSTKSPKIALCRFVSPLQTSFGTIVLLQKGIFYLFPAFPEVPSPKNTSTPGATSSRCCWRTSLRIAITVLYFHFFRFCITIDCPLRGALFSGRRIPSKSKPVSFKSPCLPTAA